MPIRIEKNFYERLFNAKIFGRARNIAAPRKAIYKNSEEYQRYMATEAQQGIISKMLRPFLSAFHKRFVWQWQRDIALQRGYIMDDLYVYEERELRRSPFTEHIFRESCHPYQWLMFKARRRRYYKVERTVQGFFVPDYVRDEVKQSTMADAIQHSQEWRDFVHDNYWSDMTPTTMMGIGGKLNPLEVFNLYGIWKLEGWERLFYNEQIYDIQDEEYYNNILSNPFGIDLETESGRREFEAKLNELISDYPGWFVPEGDSFNFTAFYAKRAIRYGGDTSQFSADVLETARAELEQQTKVTNALGVDPEGDAKLGHSNLGTEVSDVITRTCGRKAFMN